MDALIKYDRTLPKERDIQAGGRIQRWPDSQGAGILGQETRTGTASGSPSQVFVIFALAASAGRCQSAHRKSGVINRPSSAFQVEPVMPPFP